MKYILRLPLLCFALLFSGCSLAPHYERPLMDIPDQYKESTFWKIAKPSYANANTPCWWEIFEDPILNELILALNLNNQDLKIALAQFEGALAQLQIAKSAFFPTIEGNPHAQRWQNSHNMANPPTQTHYNDFLLGASLSYEIDLWGKVRNTVNASRDLAFASRDELAGIHLSLQANLVSMYFSYRGAQTSADILSKLQKAYEKALLLTRHRFEGGIASEMDVDLAITQLENVKTLLYDTQLKQAQSEHAIAVLIGRAPATFCIVPTTVQAKIPPIAPVIPSILLERRPDIAAAEKRVQAANATIGVARAAFFPSFNLVGTILGFESSSLGNLLTAPSFYWTVGPIATMTLFDGGKLIGQLNQATASYHESVATYRQTVLNALQEVEDNLAAQRYLAQENRTQAKATEAANKALKQANYRYEGGIATFLDVVVEEDIALRADLSLIDIHTRRQIAAAQLVKALGGAWDFTLVAHLDAE